MILALVFLNCPWENTAGTYYDKDLRSVSMKPPPPSFFRYAHLKYVLTSKNLLIKSCHSRSLTREDLEWRSNAQNCEPRNNQTGLQEF